jgi:hypothetical protein
MRPDALVVVLIWLLQSYICKLILFLGLVYSQSSMIHALYFNYTYAI